MSVTTFAVCLAYVGATLGVAMVVPQLLRTVRHPDLGGVSPSSWGLTALACLTWLTYGVRTATIPQIPGNVLLVSGAVSIALLVPSPVSRSTRALVLATAAAVMLGLAFAVPAESVPAAAAAPILGDVAGDEGVDDRRSHGIGWPAVVVE